MRFRERVARFMAGRYGNDQLNNFLLVTGLVFLFVSYFVSGLFYTIGLLLFLVAYFRMFSRNVYKRAAENTKYMTYQNRVTGVFGKLKWEAGQRKTHHIYRCPSCKQKIRVPRGKGRIAITCPKCRKEFIKKS